MKYQRNGIFHNPQLRAMIIYVLIPPKYNLIIALLIYLTLQVKGNGKINILEMLLNKINDLVKNIKP